MLISVPWALKKKVYSAVVEYSILPISMTSCWLMVLLSSSISVLIFYLVVLSVVQREMLKSLTKIVYLSISPFISISLLYIFFSSVVLCILLGWLYLLGGLTLHHYIMSVSGNFLCSEVYIIWYSYSHSCFNICIIYPFPFLSVSVF